MTYAIETRAKNMTGYTLYDRKRSEEIKETCEIQDVVR